MNDTRSHEAQADAIRRQLEQQLASIKFRNLLTGIIGGVLLVGISAYFYWGYTKLDNLLEPNTLVDAGANMVLEQIKPTRVALEKQIVDGAPAVAGMLSDQVYDALPKAREELEGIIEDRTKSALSDTAKMSKDQIRQFVKANRKELKESIDTLKKDENSERVIKSLMAVVEKEFGGEIKQASEDLFKSLKHINDQLAMLKDGNNLSPRQQTMRHIMMICRRVINEAPKLTEEIDSR